MGSSLFGGGTTTQNSTSYTNQDTNSQSNTTANTASNTNQYVSGATGQYGTTNQQSGQEQYNQTGQNQSTYGSSGVAGWQMPYINTGMNTAMQALMSGFNGSAPQMDYTSLSPEQQQAMDALSQYATGNSAPLMDALARYGGSLTGALGEARTGLQGILADAMRDPTQQNIRNASQYADNPYVQGMIRAAQTPIERQLKEVAVPGLNINANRGGNMDSSRAAMTEAILRGRAGVDQANVASGILGDNYRYGLGLSEQARMGSLNARLNGTGQLANIGNIGAQMAFGGNEAALRALGIPIQIGQMRQDDANRANAVAFQNQQGAAQYPWDQLAQYWNIVGKPLGTETTGNTSSVGMNSGYLSGYNTGSAGQVGSTVQNGTSNTSSTGTQTTDAQSHTNGTTNTTGSTTQPGPGIIGGTLGALSGVGSLFADGGLFSSLGLF